MNWKLMAYGLAAVVALSAVQPAQGAYGGSGTFTKITSLGDLTDGYYVIVNSTDTNAMNNVNAGTFFTHTVVAPSANTLTDPAASIVWRIQTNATYGGHTIFNEASARYVSYSGANNYSYSVAAVNGTTGVWTFAYGTTFACANKAAPTRILQYNAGAPRFACYTSAQQQLLLYKLQEAAATPPAFGANPGPLGATSGVARAFAVTATGSPSPTLALQSTTASSGYGFTAGTGQLSYTPPQSDGNATKTFTFTASNSAGVATQTVSVAVTAGTAPSFTSGAAYGATSGVAMAFTVTASGVPAPTLALQSETAAGTVNFAPGTGALNYTPDASDVGSQTFTFTASNVAGVATQSVSVTVANVAVAPSFTSGASYGATALVAMAFTVTASGNPAPTLALLSEDAAGPVDFTAGTGALDYTPATNDVGNRSFTFTASNTAGVATQTVTVAVAAAPTDIPTVSVANINTNSFTINWTACTGATDYQVQVATDTNFAAGSSSELLAEDFATQTDSTPPSGWSASGSSDLDYASEPYAGAAAPAFKFSGTGQWLQSPAFATGATNLQFFAYGNGGSGSTIAVSALVNSVWTLVDTVAIAANDGTYNVALNSQATQLKFSFTKVSYNCGFDDVVVQGTAASASLVLDRTVAVLTTDATGLAMSTTYYVRARKTGGEWSEIVSATTADPAPAAPVFGANPGPIAATATVARAFAVSATGFPAPTLSLHGTTASGGYAFTAGTGTLDYTPPTNDVGARTFTFAASNSAGVAMQTVTVNVASAPVYVPTVVLTNVGPTFLTANWNEVTDASTYQIQIGTDTNFSTAVAGSNLVNETFATLTDSTVPSGWSSSASSDLDSTSIYGAASPSFKFNLTGQWLQSPVFAAGGTNLQFWAYSRNGSGSTIAVSGLVSGVWTYVGSISVARNGATYNVALDPQTTQLKFRFTKIYTVYFDDVVIQGGTTAGSLITDETVAALTYGATELEYLTPYFVRVRAAPTGTWSTIVSATTLGNEPLAPWFTGGAGPYATTAGVAVAFTETALGVPEPTLALAAATAAAGSYAFTPETGYMLYNPPLGDAGTRTFTFTASNSMGVATQTVEVAVAAATAPAFTSGTSYGATTLVARIITVTATGVPDPVLALAGTTASAGYSFSPDAGRLSYAAPTNDTGTQTFTFTASNIAGVATQTLSVVVSNMPATAPTIDSIPPQTTVVGLDLNYTVTATDDDTAASNLTFACTSAVASATWDFDTNSGYFVFMPTTNQIGTNVFAFRATDHPTLLASPWSNMVVVVSAVGDAVAVSFGQARIVAEENAGSVSIPVNLAYSGYAAVQVRFSGPTNGTARWGTDFNCSTTLVISGASSGNLVVDLVNDALAEGPESVKLTLVPVAPATAGSVTQAVFYVRDDDTVSIMAANTTSGSSQEYEGPGNRIFQALCPDVVLIQEFNVTNGTTAAAYRTWVDQTFGTNFNYYVQANGVSIPNGVISRWPIVTCGMWDDTTLGDRDFAWAKIQLPGTQQLQAVSLHIKASSGSENVSQRTSEGRLLTNYIAQAGWLTNGHYIAIGGDFNLYSTNEAVMQVLTAKTVTDKHQPADQFGDKESNSARENPYDRVLPSTNLDARHRTFALWGYNYPNGIVYDTRIVWTNGLPPPSLAADSGAANMQHMAIMKVFELEKDDEVAAPQAFSAAAAGPSQIDLSATANALGDDVIVVGDADGTFTTPSGTPPAVDQPFAGGTVIYKGAATAFSHTGLTACSPYSYKCWSYAGTVYSTNGLTASATTAEPAAPASVWATAVTNETFTANWSPVAGAAGYHLDVCAVPSFSGGGAGWGPVFRETMGTPTAGTTTLAEHEANDGFDNDAYAMSDGGADNPADVRTSTASTNYVDPAGNAASGGANVYFATNLLVGTGGFAIGGIDSRGYEALALSFGYYKESSATNMNFALDWSTDGGNTWNPIAVSNLPAQNAPGTNWYLVSNLALDAAALNSTNLAVRWTRAAGSVPGRIDDVLLQGYADTAEFAAGYSNRTVTGATSLSVTGLTGGVTFYFRVRAVGNCEGAWSATGSATPSGTPTPPAFTSAASFGATTGVARAFTVAASGYPRPTFTLQSTTASGSRSFDAETGALAYTPAEADVGSQTFTFKAANATGAATQTVTAVVAAGAPSAPASIWASATNAATFTAVWSASALATGYRLDVSTEPTFQVLSGGSAQTVLASNAATDVSLISGDWDGTALSGTNGYVQMVQSSSTIISPAFSTVGYTNLTVDFWARTYNGVTASNITVSVSTNNGATWTALGVVNPPSGPNWMAMPTLSAAAHLGHAQTRIRWQSPDATGTIGVGVRYLAVNGWGPAYAPSFAAGWSNVAVAGTSQTVAGLTASSTYYFRVRAENAAGTSANSATANVATLPKAGQTIDFPAIGAQLATNMLALSATASSGLSASFAVGSGPAAITNGTTLTFTGAGTVSIVASQTGDAAWNPASNVTNTFVVSKAPAGVTLGGLTQAYDGAPKSATATTVPAGLTVEFTYDGGATLPSAVGNYAVTGTVVDARYEGSALGTLAISEASDLFAQWLQGRSLDPQDSRYGETADDDHDGMTTYQEYLADTDPASAGSVLALTGQYFIVSASNSTGKIRMSFPASTGRYYQLVYSTNLASPTLTNNLGWGASGMAVTNNGAGTWYGRIRALLAAP